MNLNFFPKGDWTVPSSRLRVLYLSKELNKLGMETVLHQSPTPYGKGEINRKRLGEFIGHLKLIWRLSRTDIIFSQRTIYQPEFALLLIIFKKLIGRKLIFDIDDAVYVHTPGLTKLMLRNADVVFAGGRQVERYCRKFNQRVFFLRTSIPLELY